MENEFKVGDVVVCVNSERIFPENTSAELLSVGKIYKVGGTTSTPSILLVGLKSDSLCGGFGLFRFMHLPKADDTFINQMRSLKPAKEKTNVR